MSWSASPGDLAVISRSFACDPHIAAAIAAKARHGDYAAREVLLPAGARAGHVFLVIDGHARMLAISPEGRLTVIEDFLGGDMFGEGSLLEEAPVTDEVVAVEHTSACALQSHAMVALMSAHSCIALAVSRRMIARLNTQNRRFAENASLSTVGRIHAELLRLARAGAREGSALAIRPAPVLSQLALHLQTTRETVSRAISKLEKRGVIARDADALRVIAPHRLEELIY